MNRKDKLKNQIRFLKHAVVQGDKRVRVWYSSGALLHHPKGTMTIYAKDYGQQLPKELNPENDTDMMTDYFDTDRARITPNSKYFKEVQKFLKKGY